MEVRSARNISLRGTVCLTIGGETIDLGDNLVVNDAQKVISGLMRRDSGYEPKWVVVGDGGDYEQVSKVDSGARVAPDVSDTEVRSVIDKIPIVAVDSMDDATWVYTAIAGKLQAVSPAINEFAIEAANGTLISHFITAPEGVGLRAKKYAKSGAEYLVVKWTMTLTLT